MFLQIHVFYIYIAFFQSVKSLMCFYLWLQYININILLLFLNVLYIIKTLLQLFWIFRGLVYKFKNLTTVADFILSQMRRNEEKPEREIKHSFWILAWFALFFISLLLLHFHEVRVSPSPVLEAFLESTSPTFIYYVIQLAVQIWWQI